MHSIIERILVTSHSLPRDLKPIFNAFYMENKPVEVICAEQNITVDEFNTRQAALSRQMRAAANPAPDLAS